MLLELTVENFALIKKVSVSFEKGFNILLGETGAGKSILIDAIVYVLGGKFNKELIRTGEKKTFVEAIFTIENEKTKKTLDSLGIEYDDLVIITRETYQNGKSITKLNNKTVILSILKKVSDTLIDIHGQHNNQSLLDKSSHINFLDSYGDNNLKEDLSEYKKVYDEINKVKNKIQDIQGSENRERTLEFLRFQIDDINEANLKLGEEEELNERYNFLSNSEKISKALNLSYNELKGGGSNNSILDRLYNITRELSNVQNHSEKISTINEKINDVYYTLEDISREIQIFCDDVIFDDNELEDINSRIYKISLLKKKYGKSIKKILDYKDKIENQHNEMLNSEEILNKLNLKLKEKESSLLKHGEKITEHRKIISKKLEEKIISELKFIGLEKCKFLINIKRASSYTEIGIDEVFFLISTNPGEPLRVLDKVVSGGELSRIMLALKTAFIDKDEIPTVIFDEIDTGISGRIAQAVGEKMYEISTRHQVFCITHLPQIAALSDLHYLVKKIVVEDSTFSEVEKINTHLKIEEIAKMLGGEKVTEATKKNAKEMIKLADEKKILISNIYT